MIDMIALRAARQRLLRVGLLACSLLLPLAAAAQTALNLNPSPSHVTVARSVVEGTGLSRSFKVVPNDLTQRFRNSFAITRPELLKDLDVVIAETVTFFADRQDEIIDAAARNLASRLTEAELGEIDAFFKSPTGRKYVEAQPAMMDALFRDMQVWSVQLGEAMIARIRDEMKKRGHAL